MVISDALLPSDRNTEKRNRNATNDCANVNGDQRFANFLPVQLSAFHNPVKNIGVKRLAQAHHNEKKSRDIRVIIGTGQQNRRRIDHKTLPKQVPAHIGIVSEPTPQPPRISVRFRYGEFCFHHLQIPCDRQKYKIAPKSTFAVIRTTPVALWLSTLAGILKQYGVIMSFSKARDDEGHLVSGG
ncbi:MAG: hypothetical protein ACSHWZ_04280 [Sulfitobacter sp.]